MLEHTSISSSLFPPTSTSSATLISKEARSRHDGGLDCNYSIRDCILIRTQRILCGQVYKVDPWDLTNLEHLTNYSLCRWRQRKSQCWLIHSLGGRPFLWWHPLRRFFWVLVFTLAFNRRNVWGFLFWRLFKMYILAFLIVPFIFCF